MKTLSASAVEAVVSVKSAANEIAFNMLLLLATPGCPGRNDDDTHVGFDNAVQHVFVSDLARIQVD
jgi:hypothetical protein